MINTLHQLRSRLESSALASSFYAYTSNLTIVLNAFATLSYDSWIIDSEAFNHMTSISSFSSYNVCSGREKVKIVNSMYGEGSIFFTPSISLSSVLHIPDFVANFLSIAHITNELICRVIFYYDYRLFHNLVTGRILVVVA